MINRVMTAVMSGIVLASCAGAAHAMDPLPCTKVKLGDWWFVPIYSESEGSVNAMFAYYDGDHAVGANITTALFERVDGVVWKSYTWPSVDRGQAAAYTVSRWGEQGLTLLRDGQLAAEIDEEDYKKAADGAPEPDEFATGISSSDPMWGYIHSDPEPGKVLQDLQKAGWPVAPQWSAITTVTAIQDSGDASELAAAVYVAIGSITPIETCDARVETISLVVTTVEASAEGTSSALNDVAASAETALFGSGGAALGWFCSGCTYTYTPCVGAGAWGGVSGVRTFGGWNCSWSRTGTHTCTGVAGLTWLCCNACAACPTGASSCTEVTGCTVQSPATCPATPAGCP